MSRNWPKTTRRWEMPLPEHSIAVDRHSARPLNRQIYDRVREAVARGVLGPGHRMPSARSLADQLGVARGTVDRAYAMLAGEGYLIPRGAAGTVVASGLTALATAPGEAGPPAGPAHDPSRRADAPAPRPFQMGLPALDAFPRKLWTRLAARRARNLFAAALDYRDPAGHPPLRAEICRYLGIARGITCEPGQVFITAGFQGALGLITRTLLRAGDPVWLEDPGYFLTRRAMAEAGARVVAVPVDDQGLQVETGSDRAPGARLAVATPSHQMPLGVPLSLPRRLALLEWAERSGAWVVEDDYDSEFRYTGPPLPALKSLDQGGRVLYTGTFSKVLFPALRLGYLVVPEILVPTFARVAATLHPMGSNLDQAVVADFMGAGHFARHIRRMRNLYAARRLALAEALDRELDARLRIQLQAGGMHLLARLETNESDVELVRRARADGLAPEALSGAALREGGDQGLLLSFTNIDPEQSPAVARRLRIALWERPPGRDSCSR